MNKDIGVKYNMLTGLEYAGKNKRHLILVKYLCDCGNICIKESTRVRNNRVLSCGCKMIHSKHNLANSRIYRCWINMKKRCNYHNDSRYDNYGGRGIKICDSWLNSFQNFYDDMHMTYQDDLTLDRIDINGDYCKDNCEWKSITEQNRHTTRTKLTMEKAEEIRSLYSTGKYSQLQLAIKFECSGPVISQVINKKAWI